MADQWRSENSGMPEETAGTYLNNTESAVEDEREWEPNLEIGPDFHEDTPDIDADIVPDADMIDADSPVDPAAPPTDVFNGIDLLNGSDSEE